jgi:S1-C subfamily serine protease
MSTRNSAVIVVVLLLVLGVAQNYLFGQNTSSGPAGNFVRYEHQESPHGRWQLDYYEDPSGFGREVWISENRPSAARRKLFAHYIPIKPPVIFSPDESLAAINHGSMAWGTEPAFARVGPEIRLLKMEDGAFQKLVVSAIRKAGSLPQGAEPAHVYCDALKCADSENVELKILLDCQPSPTTRWIGPFFYRYNLPQGSFSPSKEPVSVGKSPAELPQMAFESLKSFGTGFFISPKGYVLTNEHLIHGATRVSIKTKTGLLPAKLAAVSPSRDLAILKVADGDQGPASFSALQLATHPDVSLGQNVFTVGFPNPDIQGLNPKFTSGQISALTGIDDDPGMYQISVAVQPGNSGGALADEHGRAIGIVSSALDAIAVAKHTGSLPQNVNYAIKAETALPLINRILELKEAATPAVTSVATYEEAIKHVEAATVRIVVTGFPAPPAGATAQPVAPPPR